jgi:hypothetical protein
MEPIDTIELYLKHIITSQSVAFSQNRGTQIYNLIQQFVTDQKRKDTGQSIDRNYDSMGLGRQLSVAGSKEFMFLMQLYDAWFNQKQRLVLAQKPTGELFNFFSDFDFAFSQELWDKDQKVIILLLQRIVFSASKTLYKFFAHKQFEDNNSALPSNTREPPNIDQIFIRGPLSDSKKAELLDFDITLNEWLGAGKGYHRYSLFALGVSPKKGNLDGIDVIKPGLHLYSVGNLRVTLDQAKLISNAVIQELFKEFGPFEKMCGIPSHGWIQVVDLAVLKGGLRMMGSARGVDICPQCSTKDEITQFMSSMLTRISEEDNFKSTTMGKGVLELKSSFKYTQGHQCSMCNGERYTLSDRTYEPWFVANQGKIDQQLTELFQRNKSQAFLATNIRTRFCNQSDFACPPEYENLALGIETFEQDGIPQRGLKRLNLALSVQGSKEAEEGQFYPAQSKEVQYVLEQIRKWTFDSDNDGIKDRPWAMISGGTLKRMAGYYSLTLIDSTPGSATYRANRTCMRCKPHGSEIRGNEHKRMNWFKITPTRIIQRSFVDNNPECKLSLSDELTYVATSLEPSIASLLFPSKLSQASSKKGGNHELVTQQVKGFAPPTILNTPLTTRLANQARKDPEFLFTLAKTVSAANHLVGIDQPHDEEREVASNLPTGGSTPSTPRREGIMRIRTESGEDVLHAPNFAKLLSPPPTPLLESRLDIAPSDFQMFINQNGPESIDIAPTVEAIVKNAAYKPSSVRQNDPLKHLFTPRMTRKAMKEFEQVSRALLLRLRDEKDPAYREILDRQVQGLDAKAMDYGLARDSQKADGGKKRFKRPNDMQDYADRQ